MAEDRKVDKFGEHSAVADKVRKTRKQRNPCNNPELKSMGLCKKKGKSINPSRSGKSDIYGPSAQ